MCAMVVRQYVTATDDPRLPEAVIDILQRSVSEVTNKAGLTISAHAMQGGRGEG